MYCIETLQINNLGGTNMKKQPLFSFLDYIATNGDKERFDFSHPDEARQFATQLRQLIRKEGHHGIIEVEARNSAVFVKAAETAAYVGSER